jgi:hypothetical protein
MGYLPGTNDSLEPRSKMLSRMRGPLLKFINDGEKYASTFDEWALSEKSSELWRCLEKLNN